MVACGLYLVLFVCIWSPVPQYYCLRIICGMSFIVERSQREIFLYIFRYALHIW